MNSTGESDWPRWWRFVARRVREFAFLAMWVGMAWALDVYVVHPLPVSGPPKYMLHIFEGVFDISTLIELIRLIFWSHHAPPSRWLR